MEPVEIEAKTLIQRSKIPSIDYVINPCTGCVLGCAYCYASFAGRQFGQPVGRHRRHGTHRAALRAPPTPRTR